MYPDGQKPLSGTKKAPAQGRCLKYLVPEVGLEPTRHCCRRILSPLRLPIPPFRHKGIYIDFAAQGQPCFEERSQAGRKKPVRLCAASCLFRPNRLFSPSKSGPDMNDTCPTTAQSNDSPLPEDSGCQLSDVPPGRRRSDAAALRISRRPAAAFMFSLSLCPICGLSRAGADKRRHLPLWHGVFSGMNPM